jgi:hypothetical protein
MQDTTTVRRTKTSEQEQKTKKKRGRGETEETLTERKRTTAKLGERSVDNGGPVLGRRVIVESATCQKMQAGGERRVESQPVRAARRTREKAEVRLVQPCLLVVHTHSSCKPSLGVMIVDAA